MKKGIYTITENRALTKNVFLMRLAGDTSAFTAPGQFVNIALDGLYLRRPISVCDLNENEITLIYKVVGEGTEKMSRLTAGAALDLLTGLGNGFDTAASGDSPVLIGGGVGVPPLFYLAKKLIGEGKHVTVILGFNTKDEIFFQEEFQALGADVLVTTVDGSVGIKGFVTDALSRIACSYYYCCGPLPMLKAVHRAAASAGQLSFEERMGCGFGACMGCTCQTKNGNKRICKEGPVLCSEEVLW